MATPDSNNGSVTGILVPKYRTIISFENMQQALEAAIRDKYCNSHGEGDVQGVGATPVAVNRPSLSFWRDKV